MGLYFESVKFENVTLALGNQEILRSCDFSFPMGQNVRIVFRDDREKFFFFHAMTQMEGFEKGRYLINDQDVTEMSFEEFLPFRLKIGVGFSRRGLIHNRTLRQNLELPLRYHSFATGKVFHEWMNYCVEYFDFHKELDKRPAEVSPSAQKSTLILRAFIHKPEMVFLDTPELMLSTKLQANLLQLIDDHRKNFNLKHLFFATSDEDLSDCLVDKNIILEKKKLKTVEVQSLARIAL